MVTDLLQMNRYFHIQDITVIIDEIVLQLGNTDRTPLHQTVDLITLSVSVLFKLHLMSRNIPLC